MCSGSLSRVVVVVGQSDGRHRSSPRPIMPDYMVPVLTIHSCAHFPRVFGRHKQNKGHKTDWLHFCMLTLFVRLTICRSCVRSTHFWVARALYGCSCNAFCAIRRCISSGSTSSSAVLSSSSLNALTEQFPYEELVQVAPAVFTAANSVL